jgi:hypothetical protein
VPETDLEPLGTHWSSGKGSNPRTLLLKEAAPGSFTLHDSARHTPRTFRAARAVLGCIQGGTSPALFLQVGP